MYLLHLHPPASPEHPYPNPQDVDWATRVTVQSTCYALWTHDAIRLQLANGSPASRKADITASLNLDEAIAVAGALIQAVRKKAAACGVADVDRLIEQGIEDQREGAF